MISWSGSCWVYHTVSGVREVGGVYLWTEERNRKVDGNEEEEEDRKWEELRKEMWKILHRNICKTCIFR